MKARHVAVSAVVGAATAVGVGFGLWFIGVPGEYAVAVGVLAGLSAGVSVATAFARSDELRNLGAVDRPDWSPEDFERNLSQHSAWTHGDKPWWVRGGRR